MTGTRMPENKAPSIISRRNALACAVIAILFAIWGLAQWDYNILFPQFAQYLQFNSSQTTWTQALFNVTYCLFAVPAALLHRRFGYKLGVIFALSICALGPFLLYPAITLHGRAYLLAAVVVMGAGWTLLETSLNPMAAGLGPRETSVRRLNLAQAFYPVGLFAGYIVAQMFLQPNYELSHNRLAQAVQYPFVVIGLAVLLLAFVFDNVRFPAEVTQRADRTVRVRVEFRTLLSRKDFRLAVAALFCAILAQATTWGATFAYVPQQLPQAAPSLGAEVFLWSCIICAIGRFAGTAVMRWMDPVRLLAWCIAITLALMIPVLALGGMTGVVCLVSTSLFMSITYPTIFGTAIRDLGAMTKIASGLLVTAAGLASALAPFATNLVIGSAGARVMLILPLLCFPVILAYAAAVRRTGRAPAPDARPAVLAPLP